MEFVQRKTVEHFRGLLIALAAILALVLMAVFLLRVTRIEAGHVGVEINLAGSQRGASEIPIRTGGWFTARCARRSSNFRPTCKP